MKKVKFLFAFVLLAVVLVLGPKVYAYTTGGTQTSSTNIITLPWHPGTPNLYWRFYFKETNETVYCIEPHVVFNGNHTYNGLGKYSQATGGDARIGRAMAYVIATGEVNDLGDENARQIKQTVIWALNGDYDIYGLDRGNGYVNRAIAVYENALNAANGTDVWNLMNNHSLSFHLEGSNWVSNWIYIRGGSGVSCDMGGLQRDGDNWRLVVDNNSLSGTVYPHIYAEMSGQNWEEVDVYDGPNNTSSNGQTVVVGGGASSVYNREEAGGSITPVGNLAVVKQDNHGRVRSGATFHVTGPGGTWDITTGGDGRAVLNNITIGTYTITETQAPANMKNEEANRTVNVGVSAGQTATFTRYNSFPRGAVTITKYDGDHRGATLGDATIQGAKFALYAAEQIKEGDTVIYNANQIIRDNIITKADGTTDYVTDLPIGNYYYVETEPSEGFLINTNRVPVAVTYAGQYAAAANNGTCETPESPIYGNLRIVKTLGQTDYDPIINLEGAQFKLTLIKDNSQVYYSNTSGSDGVCQFTHIPYGKYTLSECVTPASAYTVADREVFIQRHNETIPMNIEDAPKEMRISVNKEILLREGEATDAVVSGAIFTVYLDEACTQQYIDKNGDVVKIGPTDENGYAISNKMRTGQYYLKETTFPEGIDPDAVIPNENVTYRNKVYSEFYNNAEQGPDVVTVNQRVINEPVRNHLEIIKHVGETSNTPQFPLDQCEFTATLISSKGTDHEFSRKCTAETTRDTGYCIIEDLPYGTYEVEETKVSPITLKCDKFTFKVGEDKKVKTVPYKPKDGTFETTILNQNPQTKWLDLEGNLVDIPKVMVIKIHKVDTDRTDADSKTYMQGDANLEGAVYEIWRYDPMTDDYTEYVYDITVDHLDDGYWTATSDELLVGNYMVKEKVKSTEEVDGVIYEYSYAEGYLTDPNEYYFIQDPAAQTERLTTHVDISNDTVVRGRVHVLKFDEDRSNVDVENDSDKVPSAGAILRLTLDSNPDIYYTVKLDDNGYGEFIETNDDTHTSTAVHDSKPTYYPNTIPYGKYTITEDKEADNGENTSFYTQPEAVEIPTQCKQEYRIEADEPVPVWLKITKKDATTNEVVELSAAEFQLYDVKKQEFVEMRAGVGKRINKFKTNTDGYLYTPEKLQPGQYIIYEINAPKGYFLQKNLRRPENEVDLGDATKGGKPVSVNKVATGLELDDIYPGQVYTGELEIGTDMSDQPLYVNIRIYKTGEKVTGAQTEEVRYTKTNGDEVSLDKVVPVYSQVGLEGVSYKIYADEDIYTPDGVLRTRNGTLVDDITTNSEGIAQSRMDLFPGKYKVVEYEVPDGYLLDTTPKYVLAENENQLVESATATLNISDVRQKLNFTFEKLFEQFKYSNGDESKHAVFGVYTKEPIETYNGQLAIAADTLVDLLVADDNSILETVELPQGQYYVKELYVSYPYALSTEQVDFELEYNGDGVTPLVTTPGPQVVNNVEYGYAKLIKLSTTVDDKLVLIGSKVESDGLEEKTQEIIEDIKNMTDEQLTEYIQAKGYQFVSGAEYELWLDKDGTKKLQEVNLETGEKSVAKFVTNNSGVLKLQEIPKGQYFLKETKAPEDYVVQEDAIEFTISSSDLESALYKPVFDDTTKTTFLHKTDIFTGKNVPNCRFEVTDENGKVLVSAITGEDGLAWIPSDAFVPYKDNPDAKFYYTETDAPDVYKEDGRLYKLNTEPHEFTGHYDEEMKRFVPDIHEVENYRPTTNVKFVKTDDKGNLVPNCKFELKSEEEGLYEPKTGVTDENGIYVFEKVPQGWYTYTELEAPEEYDLDTNPHRVYVTGDKMIIDFVNTGDIPVIALAVLGVICVAGISFVTVRKVKASKNA